MIAYGLPLSVCKDDEEDQQPPRYRNPLASLFV